MPRAAPSRYTGDGIQHIYMGIQRIPTAAQKTLILYLCIYSASGQASTLRFRLANSLVKSFLPATAHTEVCKYSKNGARLAVYIYAQDFFLKYW